MEKENVKRVLLGLFTDIVVKLMTKANMWRCLTDGCTKAPLSNTVVDKKLQTNNQGTFSFIGFIRYYNMRWHSPWGRQQPAWWSTLLLFLQCSQTRDLPKFLLCAQELVSQVTASSTHCDIKHFHQKHTGPWLSGVKTYPQSLLRQTVLTCLLPALHQNVLKPTTTTTKNQK